MKLKKIYLFFQQKKSRIFVISLLVSLLMWFVANLSKQYTKEVVVKISFVNVTNGNLVKCNDSVLTVKIKGTGFSLWSSRLQNLKYEIPVNEYKTQWNWQQNEYAFKEIFPQNISVLQVAPMNVNFKQFKLFAKKVEILPQLTVQPKLGYGVITKLLKPDSIIIYGHQNEIKKINRIKTDSLFFKNVIADVSGKIAFKLPKGVLQVSDKNISYYYKIEHFTQGEFLIPVQLINVPENMEISIFPKQVQVQFEAPLSTFDQYKPQHFLLTVDGSNLQKHKNLPIELEKTPNGMKNVRLLKKSVTFLVLNK